MYICICNAITEKDVRKCARDGARCIEDLTAALGVAAPVLLGAPADKAVR